MDILYSIKDFIFSLLRDIWDFLLELYNKYNLDMYVKYFLYITAGFIILIFVMFILDYFRKYDCKKLFKKKGKRGAIISNGGAEEYYLKYWVWQRNKRKWNIKTLTYVTKDNMYFPKEKWKNKTPGKKFFKREIVINTVSIDWDKFKQLQQ